MVNSMRLLQFLALPALQLFSPILINHWNRFTYNSWLADHARFKAVAQRTPGAAMIAKRALCISHNPCLKMKLTR